MVRRHSGHWRGAWTRSPGLEVTLLLNIERRRGDTTVADSLVRRFADEFRGREWPGAVRPKVYFDPRSLEMGGPTGVLHAKAVGESSVSGRSGTETWLILRT